MDENKLNKRVEFPRQEKLKCIDHENQDVWIDVDNDVASHIVTEQGLQIFTHISCLHYYLCVRKLI